MSDKRVIVKIGGPLYSDGYGTKFGVEYDSDHDGKPRLTIHQYSDNYISVEGPDIKALVEAIKEAISKGEG